MQAIVTKFICATNYKPSRIKAICEAGSVTIPYPHELSGMAVHRAAAEALAVKLGWDTERYGKLIGGALPSKGSDYCYAFVFDNGAGRE